MIEPLMKLSLFLVFYLTSMSLFSHEAPKLEYTGTKPRIQKPLSPQDSIKHMHLDPAFEPVLFASEPQIINPIHFTWDERGRLWVIQSFNYPHHIGEKNGKDIITICEDIDQDGKADKFTNFAVNQPLSTSLVVVKGGCIVAQEPNIVYLEDTDGDDKFDKRTILSNGWGTFDSHAGLSNFFWGIDNKIWGAVGYSGSDKYKFKNGIFKFSKTSPKPERIAQFNNNTWGASLSEEFEIFGSTANNNHVCHVPIPINLSGGQIKSSNFIQGHYHMYPKSAEPLQQVDVRGGFTAACGANLYTARHYPKKYWGMIMINEPTGHLIHLGKLTKNGASYKEKDAKNLMASSDAWTSPIHSAVGPDGNVWFADWYNPIIQHNPDKRGMINQVWNNQKGEGNAHQNPLRDKKHGRLYILKYKSTKYKYSLNKENKNNLIKALKDDNMFWRLQAQRLIIEHEIVSCIPELQTMANEQAVDVSQQNYPAIHALWSLDGLGKFNEGQNINILKGSLKHKSSAVRKSAIKILKSDIEKILINSNVLYDKDLNVRLAAILKLIKLKKTPELNKAIDKVDQLSDNDKWCKKILDLLKNRKAKIDPKDLEIFIPSAEEKGASWQYTFSKPADNWKTLNFDDSKWQTGKGGFGHHHRLVNTKWTTPNIYLRRIIKLNKDMPIAYLKMKYNAEVQLYINGQLITSNHNKGQGYEIDRLPFYIFQKGKNIIAIHSQKTSDDQYIDLGFAKAKNANNVRQIKISTINTAAKSTKDKIMGFNKKSIKVKAGSKLSILFSNSDQMPHNFVIIKPGQLKAFGKAVDDMLADTKAAEKSYIPETDDLIIASKMLNPNELQKINFTAPKVKGSYPFLCTFPGHWRIMQGTLIVE